MLPENRFPKLHDSCYSMGVSVFKFTQLFSKAKERSTRAVMRDTTDLSRLLSREPARISAQTLCCQ